MDRLELSNTLLEAKKRNGLTWTDLSKTIGMSEVWLASLFRGAGRRRREDGGSAGSPTSRFRSLGNM
jgi:cyanate lyase